jgi:hypothetical protein
MIGHRNKTSELSRKQGTTLIGTFRTHYGPRFAKGHSDALHKFDEPSLSKLGGIFRLDSWKTWSGKAGLGGAGAVRIIAIMALDARFLA